MKIVNFLTSLRGYSHMKSARLWEKQTPFLPSDFAKIPPPPSTTSVICKQCPIVGMYDQIHIINMIWKTYIQEKIRKNQSCMTDCLNVPGIIVSK